MISWSKLIKPGAWGGKNEVTAGSDQIGEPLEEFFRIGESANKVGGMDTVEATEIVREIHRVALQKTAGFWFRAIGDYSRGRCCLAACFA